MQIGARPTAVPQQVVMAVATIRFAFHPASIPAGRMKKRRDVCRRQTHLGQHHAWIVGKRAHSGRERAAPEREKLDALSRSVRIKKVGAQPAGVAHRISATVSALPENASSTLIIVVACHRRRDLRKAVVTAASHRDTIVARLTGTVRVSDTCWANQARMSILSLVHVFGKLSGQKNHGPAAYSR